MATTLKVIPTNALKLIALSFQHASEASLPMLELQLQQMIYSRLLAKLNTPKFPVSCLCGTLLYNAVPYPITNPAYMLTSPTPSGLQAYKKLETPVTVLTQVERENPAECEKTAAKVVAEVEALLDAVVSAKAKFFTMPKIRLEWDYLSIDLYGSTADLYISAETWVNCPMPDLPDPVLWFDDVPVSKGWLVSPAFEGAKPEEAEA